MSRRYCAGSQLPQFCSLSHKLLGLHSRYPPSDGQHFISNSCGHQHVRGQKDKPHIFCIWFTPSFWRSTNTFERIYQRLFSFKSIKVIKRCCDVFGQISILPSAVFLQTLLFRPWREFFKSGETHLWNLHTLSTRDPPYHTLCFYIYKTQEQRVFFSKLFRIFCRNNIQGNLSIMIKILVMSAANPQCRKEKGPCQPDQVQEIGC